MEKELLTYRRLFVVCLVVLCGLSVACDDDDEDDDIDTIGEIEYNNVSLLGANERPVIMSAGAGEMDATYNDMSNTLNYTITWQLGNAGDSTTAMHFHGPADPESSAPPVIDIEQGFDQGSSGTISGTTRALTQAEEDDLKAGLWYVNIHSDSHPGGELRGNLLQ
jgi:CHRD domain